MTDVPIPKGWVSSTIGDVCALNPKIKLPDDLQVGFMTMSGVPTDFLGSSEFDIRPWEKVKKGFTQFKNGDVIFAKITPCFENGKAAIIDGLPNQWGAGSTEYYVLRPYGDLVSPRLLFALVKTKEFLVNGAVNMSGSVGHKRVPKDFVSGYQLPIPPLAEQKAIADKLDTLLAQVETTKACLERIPKILKRFRQSVLAGAVSGRLTKEWRAENTTTSVDKTLWDVASERAQDTKGRAKEPQAHLTQEEFPIPDSWRWVSLDALAKKIVDGTHHTPTYVNEGIPFISVKDIKNGEINFNNTKFISEEEHNQLARRCAVENGDLLITKSGTIGRTALVSTDNPFSIFVSVALIKPVSSKVNVEYIDLALRKWVNEIDISSRIVGSAIKNLHLRDMKVLAVPFAPLEEQSEIVRRANHLFSQADRIEEKVSDALARINNLTQAILAKAFRGELTEQWRKDNPDLISGENSAEALLQRINAEREKLSAQKPKRQKRSKQ